MTKLNIVFGSLMTEEIDDELSHLDVNPEDSGFIMLNNGIGYMGVSLGVVSNGDNGRLSKKKDSSTGIGGMVFDEAGEISFNIKQLQFNEYGDLYDKAPESVQKLIDLPRIWFLWSD